MSSKAKNTFVCALLLVSALAVGFTVLDPSQNLSSPMGDEETASGSIGSPSSNSASSAIGADNDKYDGNGMVKLNKTQRTLRLGSDNPEHPGQAHGRSYKSYSGTYYNCYSEYYKYLYKSSFEYRGWSTFDLKDVEPWEGVKVISASLIINTHYRYYVKEAKFTSLETTPFAYPGSAIAKKVYTESGPSGTEIGSVSFASKWDLSYHSFKVELDSTAVDAINAKLASNATHKTFGIGAYVADLFPGYSYGYLRWTDVRLEVSFEYDEELQSTEVGEGVAFGDDITGHFYKYTSAYHRPYGYSYLRNGTSYEYRAYYQWNVPSILSAFEETNASNIQFTKASLRFNHRYSSLSDISVHQLIYNMSDTNVSNNDKFADCGNGTVYYSSGSVGSSFNEYEWDLGPDAVNDFQNAFDDNDLDYFGLGITTTYRYGYSYDYGPRSTNWLHCEIRVGLRKRRNLRLPGDGRQCSGRSLRRKDRTRLWRQWNLHSDFESD
jgi:hypothetical protein